MHYIQTPSHIPGYITYQQPIQQLVFTLHVLILYALPSMHLFSCLRTSAHCFTHRQVAQQETYKPWCSVAVRLGYLAERYNTNRETVLVEHVLVLHVYIEPRHLITRVTANRKGVWGCYEPSWGNSPIRSPRRKTIRVWQSCVQNINH